MTRKFFLSSITLFSFIFLFSCQGLSDDYETSPNGLKYKIIVDNKQRKALPGGVYGVTAGVAYTPDAWNDIKVRADIDNDYGALYINSVFVYSWQWSIGLFTDGDAHQIGGIDVFAYSADGSNADYYVDDVLLQQVPAACNIPYGLYIDKLTANAVRLNWAPTSPANKYKVRYRQTGTEVWKTGTSSTIKKALYNLSAGTEYDWQVRSVCNDAGLGNSAWSNTSNFTTYSYKLNDEAAEQTPLTIYPNPANAFTTIQFKLQQSSHVNIKVYDVSGREVATLLNDDLAQGDHSLQINTSQFTKGIYMVRLSSDSEIQNQKLIVQ